MRKYGNDYQIVEEAYFGPDGKPALSKSGYARWTARYEGSRQIELRYFDVAGQPVKTRVRAQYVEATGIAGKAGLKAGDLLVSYAGKPIATVLELEAHRDAEPRDGPAKPLVIERDGKPLSLQVGPGGLDDEFEDFVAAEKPAKK